MEKVDWSKAPEWATVRLQHRDDQELLGWASAYVDDAKFLRGDNPRPLQGFRVFFWRVIAERPSPTWNGSGLPPAGTVCEVHNGEFRNPEWERCTILFMGAFRCVYASDSCHERVADVYDGSVTAFRPIRTPEQIAAEEREAAVAEMINSARPMNRRSVCEDLYDAGYRKQEPKL